MSQGTPKDGSTRDATPSDEERIATEWFFRRDAGLTAKEEQAFDSWLRADPRHAEALGQIEATWDAMDRMRDRIVARTPALVRRHPSHSALVAQAWGLGLAAALALAYFGWWRPSHFSGTASTEVGELRTMTLPDGSMIELNTDSAVSVRFTFSQRRIRLVQGEARFMVAKNPARPFVVETGGIAVRAVGTAFDVRLRPREIDVMVTEGKVRVSDSLRGESLLAVDRRNAAPNSGKTDQNEFEPPVVAAGERVTIQLRGEILSTANAISSLTPLEIDQALAWRSRRVAFSDASLAEMVAEFNRYNRHKLVIADPSLATRRFGGTFPAADYESFVQLLVSTFGVVAERGTDETVLRLSR
jgi:transmembrane sensor